MPKFGILVHGRHVAANGWDRLVWGDVEQQKMGSLPMMVLTALQVGLDNIAGVVFGTGASERDGVKEADCMKRLLIDQQQDLLLFTSICEHSGYDHPLLVASFLDRIITETASQNTNEEVENAAKIFADLGADLVFQISSASHLPRCVKTVSELREKGLIPKGQMWCGVADDMTFGDLGAGATAILETPHRGDDAMGQVDSALWPSTVVPKLFKLPLKRRVAVLTSLKSMIEAELTDKVV